ncbi:hypothetical protein GPECTOR_12g531 [Gonium pectorale]|uniref:Uncharacterized protein n=1 Tax=Gonium pectorale TaxID=33097 RepID=A0A150GPA3_GONPE|nr:hypothetical protein GPECTOR_12g531 [Gonium pectorale]|eukprot:KXZ51568.1 hypothetical protein GPECTOR_12g531 [Gonium pectorale]
MSTAPAAEAVPAVAPAAPPVPVVGLVLTLQISGAAHPRRAAAPMPIAPASRLLRHVVSASELLDANVTSGCSFAGGDGDVTTGSGGGLPRTALGTGSGGGSGGRPERTPAFCSTRARSAAAPVANGKAPSGDEPVDASVSVSASPSSLLRSSRMRQTGRDMPPLPSALSLLLPTPPTLPMTPPPTTTVCARPAETSNCLG